MFCNKCGKVDNIADVSQFDIIKPDYCITSQNNTITCSNCGEKCNIGLIEYKKNVTIKQSRTNHPNMQYNQTHCIYCNSTDVRKISNLSKAGSVALFGIFSQKVKKQWHCNNCGSDF